MKISSIKKGLTKGLLAGYGGKSKFEKIIRGAFKVSCSHFEDNETIYHDEWTNGGGQEIVKVGNDMFTRVYAGGIIEEGSLIKMGIDENLVIGNLINRIKELGDKTRLFENCKAKNDNGWDYEYKVLDKEDLVEVTVGKEVVRYKDKIVFVHYFVLSPVK